MIFYFFPDSTVTYQYLISDGEKTRYTCLYHEDKFIKTLYSQEKEIVATGFFDFTEKKMALRLHTYIIKLNKEDIEVKIYFKPLLLTCYYFEYKKDKYKAILHLGKKISIFKNENQIGYYVTDSIISAPDIHGMKLIVNDDTNLPLLILFCLHLYSDFRGEDAEGGNPAFNLVVPLKKFNKKWKPNDSQ
jgi:hypothetical protein